MSHRRVYANQQENDSMKAGSKAISSYERCRSKKERQLSIQRARDSKGKVPWETFETYKLVHHDEGEITFFSWYHVWDVEINNWNETEVRKFIRDYKNESVFIIYKTRKRCWVTYGYDLE